jgi:hypothetical protein
MNETLAHLAPNFHLHLHDLIMIVPALFLIMAAVAIWWVIWGINDEN